MKFSHCVCSRYPRHETIFLIQDHLSAHTTLEVLGKADRLSIRFAPIPANALKCNPIETHFRAIREIALEGTDYRSLRELFGAIQEPVRELNQSRSTRPHKVRRRLWARH